jgi:thioesterase domain-containing protein/acyl carrier protein
VDRNALPQSGNERPTLDVPYVAPQSLLQLQLVQIWERSLKLREIGIHDNFFELGGNSLLAVQMLLDVEQSLGMDIDGSSLLAAPTIESLAALIHGRDPHSKQPIVQLREGDGATPLVFLHGDYISGGFYCFNLAKSLDKSFPFFVMSPLSLRDDEREYSFEAMATRHLAQLRLIQPVGPYYLGGNCNGGLVAYEMARQLRAQGEIVALLALFNASADNLRFKRLNAMVNAIGKVLGFNLRQRSAVFFRLREIWNNLSSHSFSGKLAYAIRKIRVMPSTAWELFRPSENPLVVRNQADIAYKHYHYLDATYVPRRYDGKVTLILPADQVQSAAEIASWWRQIAAGVEVHSLTSGHHASLTSEVGQLGAKLNECLREARASVRLSPTRRPRPSAE